MYQNDMQTSHRIAPQHQKQSLFWIFFTSLITLPIHLWLPTTLQLLASSSMGYILVVKHDKPLCLLYFCTNTWYRAPVSDLIGKHIKNYFAFLPLTLGCLE